MFCAECGVPAMQSRHQLKKRILATDDVDGAVDVLAESIRDIGIERFVAGFVNGAAQDTDGRWRLYKHRSFNFPERWDEGWHAYNAHCPYYHSCFDGRIAFDWASVRRRRDLSPKETLAWRYLADFGLIDGFTVPVHAPGHFGFVTVVGEKTDRGWARRIETQSERLLFVSHVFHEAVRERFADFVDPTAETPLSRREQECLRWAAAGKTTEDIAAILSLSGETVRVYMKRTLRKLNAGSRTQAVAIALKRGLIA